jgi:hypothetical protein
MFASYPDNVRERNPIILIHFGRVVNNSTLGSLIYWSLMFEIPIFDTIHCNRIVSTFVIGSDESGWDHVADESASLAVLILRASVSTLSLCLVPRKVSSYSWWGFMAVSLSTPLFLGYDSALLRTDYPGRQFVFCQNKLLRRLWFMGLFYEGEPQNNRNLNVARELEVVVRCAARCRVSTQYSSSLPRGVSLGWVLLLLWLFL